jgi:hypothetical protein
MNAIKKTLLYYGLGIALSVIIIGLIHFYSLLFETYFSYAAWNNITTTALSSGVPFGIVIWAYRNFNTNVSEKIN